MNTTSQESDQWQACPPGELGRMTSRLRRRRQMQIATRVAVTASVLLIAVGGLSWQFRAQTEPPVVSKPGEGFNFGGITCAGVHRALPQLKAGTIDAATLGRVREHLEKCDHCKALSRYLPDAANRVPVRPFEVVDVNAHASALYRAAAARTVEFNELHLLHNVE